MGWRHNELDKWTYYDDNTNEQKLGWQQIDGEYYYLYSDDITKGWFKDKSDSNWYYFAPSKQVIDGKQWYKGQMLHGVWLDYKNKWYDFNEESGYGGFYKGQMIHSCTYTTPYGKTYQFDDEGALIDKPKISAIDIDGTPMLFGKLLVASGRVTEDGELTELTKSEVDEIMDNVATITTSVYKEPYPVFVEMDY